MIRQLVFQLCDSRPHVGEFNALMRILSDTKPLQQFKSHARWQHLVCLVVVALEATTLECHLEGLAETQ